MDIFVDILALLVITRLFGEAAERLGQTASVGEMLAGIFLAGLIAVFGTSLPIIGRLPDSEALAQLAEIGIFFLVLLAGIELQPKSLAKHAAAGFGIALGGMAVPMAFGFGLAWVFLPDIAARPALSMLVALALSITAIPATVKVLMEAGLLQQRPGQIIVAAALFDDVFSILLFAILAAVLKTGALPSTVALGWIVVKAMAFFGVTMVLGVHVYPRIGRRIRLMQAAAIEFSFLVAVALFYGLLAELLGLHWVLGAFMAGLFFESSRVGAAVHLEMKLLVTAITGGVLAPLFFASIGLQVDLRAVAAAPVFIIALIATAIAGKLLGAGIPTYLAYRDRREAGIVGIGMSARGAFELIILSIALKAGLFAQTEGQDGIAQHLFSSLVLMAVATTLLTPILLRWLLKRPADGGDRP